MAKTQPTPPAEAAARPTLVGRVLGLLRNWKVASGLGVLAMLAIIGTMLAVTLFFGRTSHVERGLLLPRALAELDDGNLVEARVRATELRNLPEATFADRGGALYVLGSVLAREAQEHPNLAQQRVLYLVASRYLERAHTHGFPPEREADALLALGRALHRSGQQGPAVPILSEALTANPHAAAELHALLAESCLALTPPRFTEALDHTQRYLAIPKLSQRQQHVGRLLQGRVLLAQGDTTRAAEVVIAIPVTSPLAVDAIMLRAQVAIAAARKEQRPGTEPTAATVESLTATIAALRGLESRPGIDREVVPQAQLVASHCYLLAGDRRAAIAGFDRLRRVRFGRADGLAATFFLAELRRQEGQPAAALELYQLALQQAGPRDLFQNPWLSLDEFEGGLAAATSELTVQGNYGEAVKLARAMLPLTSEALSLRQRIAAHQGWANQLLAQAAAQPSLAAEVTRAEARQHLRQAGADGERLAELGVATRHYIDDLATAAENYQLGQGYRQAARVWREFLRQNPPQRRPEAMVGLGQSLFALGEVDAALKTLQSCREEFPTHPTTYSARVLESQCWQEKGELAKASELLHDNLYRHSLTPQSADWRDSLFALGQLLYRQACDEETKSRLAGVDQADAESMKQGLKLLEQSYATFHEAIRVLTEAVQRYPAAAQAVQARFWIAEAYRHSALAPRKKLAVTNIETSRLALNRQITQELEAAYDEYQKLVTVLSDEQQLPRRTSAELVMLRNCYFGRADVLFDLNRFEEAIQAYSAATNRYQHDPESLEAYVQIATCYRRLKRPNEARGTLEQARVVLSRIRPDADFLRTTRLDRQQWGDLLTWLRTL